MKSMEQTASARRGATGIALAAFGILGLVPWRVVAQEPPLSHGAAPRPVMRASQAERPSRPLPPSSAARVMIAERWIQSGVGRDTAHPPATVASGAAHPQPDSRVSGSADLAPSHPTASRRPSGPTDFAPPPPVVGGGGRGEGASLLLAEAPLGQFQADVPSGRHADTPLRQFQADLPSGRGHADTPLRQFHADLPSGRGHADIPAKRLPADLPSGQWRAPAAPGGADGLPGKKPGVSAPADLPLEKPGVSAPGGLPGAQPGVSVPAGLPGRKPGGERSLGLPAGEAASEAPAGLPGTVGVSAPAAGIGADGAAGVGAPAAGIGARGGFPGGSAGNAPAALPSSPQTWSLPAARGIGTALPLAVSPPVRPATRRRSGLRASGTALPAAGAATPEEAPLPLGSERVPPTGAPLELAAPPLQKAPLQPMAPAGARFVPVWIAPEALPDAERARLEQEAGRIGSLLVDQRTGRILMVLHARPAESVGWAAPAATPLVEEQPAPSPAKK